MDSVWNLAVLKYSETSKNYFLLNCTTLNNYTIYGILAFYFLPIWVCLELH